jgi:8-oxo-dGTP pyrophosphatase MutT (NUDIX family)
MSTAIHASAAPYAIPLADLQSQHWSKRLVIGAAIVSPTKPHKILIARRAASESEFAGLYELPGGGSEADLDATLIDTVVRETAEETGLKVTGILGCFEGFEYETGKGKSVQINFLVEVEGGATGGDEGVVVTLNPEEHDAFAWVGADELDSVGTTYALSGAMEFVVKDALKALQKQEENN